VGREGNGIERLGVGVSEAETGGEDCEKRAGEVFVRGGPGGRGGVTGIDGRGCCDGREMTAGAGAGAR
jgi:hypothetical protein